MIASGPTVDVFANRPRLLRGTLLVMFAAAIAIRLMQLDRPGVLVDRDYTSAMFARAWFFENRSDVPDWRREMAAKLAANQPTLESRCTPVALANDYRIYARCAMPSDQDARPEVSGSPRESAPR